jgi:hypothetical protein
MKRWPDPIHRRFLELRKEARAKSYGLETRRTLRQKAREQVATARAVKLAD